MGTDRHGDLSPHAGLDCWAFHFANGTQGLREER